MKRIFSLCLSIILISVSAPASNSAAVETCPDLWELNFEPTQEWLTKRGPMGIDGFPDFFKESTGLLDEKKKTLGNSIAVEYRTQYSKDNINWIAYSWPMKLPNDESSYIGLSFFFLHPGYVRGVYSVEVQSCKKPGVFYTQSLKSSEMIVVKDRMKIEDVVPKNLNFKDAASYLQKLKDDLNLELQNYKKTGIIRERYPIDEHVLSIAPIENDCLIKIGLTWKSKGKSCDIYVYSLGRSSNGTTENNDFVEKFLYFIVDEISLPAFRATSVILCVKGKLTKKVTSVSPKCPSGYKKKP